MNQTFDLNRCWLLVAKHWSENRKKYLLSLTAIAGLFLLWFSFLLIMEIHRPLKPELQAVTYFVGLLVISCIYGSMFFSDLASKSRGINYLSLPASHLEKLLCTLFYAVLIFFISYTVVFYIVDFMMVKIANAIYFSYWKNNHSPNDIFTAQKLINIFVMPNRPKDAPNIFLYLLLISLALQAAFILGSVYFPKFSFLKTLISLVLIVIFFIFFIAKILPSFMPDGFYYNGITSYKIIDHDIYNSGKIVQLPAWIDKILQLIIKFAFAPIFWAATYFRLKEKEI